MPTATKEECALHKSAQTETDHAATARDLVETLADAIGEENPVAEEVRRMAAPDPALAEPIPIALAGQELMARPHPQHDYLVTTAEVANGYGVSESSIREHKRLREKEGDLAEGRHFSRVRNPDAGIRVTTYWTKAGIVRLGFFIRSEKARAFRDAAEALILGHLSGPMALGGQGLPLVDIQGEVRELSGLVADLTVQIEELEEDRGRHLELAEDMMSALENLGGGEQAGPVPVHPLRPAVLAVLKNLPAEKIYRRVSDHRGDLILVPAAWMRRQVSAALGRQITGGDVMSMVDLGLRVPQLRPPRSWMVRKPGGSKKITCWAFLAEWVA